MRRQGPLSGVLVVDSDVARAGALADLFRGHHVVKVATTIAGARKELQSALFDGFIVDVELSDGSGIELLAPIRERNPHEPILLTCCCDGVEASRSATLHRAFFITKPLPDDCAVAFRDAVIQGQRGSASELMKRLGALGLSAREIEVITLLAQGGTAATVGSRLHISARTVQGHCFAVYTRLGARNLAEVLALANGWIDR